MRLSRIRLELHDFLITRNRLLKEARSFRLIALAVIDYRQAVTGVGGIGLQAESFLKANGCLVKAVELEIGRPEIVPQLGIVRTKLHGVLIIGHCFGETSLGMADRAEQKPGLRLIGRGLQHVTVRLLGSGQVPRLMIAITQRQVFFYRHASYPYL